MRKNMKIVQALVERPAELERLISADEKADKLSLADTLITLMRSSSVDAVEEAQAENKILRMPRRD